MYNTSDPAQRAAEYMSMYGGQSFQCIKTKDPKDSRLGEVFTNIKVELGRDNNVYIVLPDKSRVPVDVFNNCFMMISEYSPAMPKEAVRRSQKESIPSAVEFAAESMETLDQAQLDKVKAAAINNKEANVRHASVPQLDVAPIASYPGEITSVERSTTPQPQVQTKQSSEDLAKSLFGMFLLQPTDVEFEVPVELPDLNMIQMMYSQSVNKEEFLTKFATYVLNGLTVDVVKKSLTTLLEPKPKKIRATKS